MPPRLHAASHAVVKVMLFLAFGHEKYGTVMGENAQNAIHVIRLSDDLFSPYAAVMICLDALPLPFLW